MKVKELVMLAVCTAILFVAQIAFASLPNIELVSLLIILFTLLFGRKVLFIIYSFALLQGFLYGFSLWWITYLYVWTVLALFTWLFRRQSSPLFWAILSGLFGLSFGALCSIPTFITGFFGGGFSGGISAAAAWWVSGIPFDLLHCGGNFVVALLLFRPLLTFMKKVLYYSSESKSI